jgi:hypothetical protein
MFNSQFYDGKGRDEKAATVSFFFSHLHMPHRMRRGENHVNWHCIITNSTELSISREATSPTAIRKYSQYFIERRRFITVLIGALRRFLSWARSIHSITSHSFSIRSIYTHTHTHTHTNTHTHIYVYISHAVAQWLKHYAISRKVVCSRPDEVNDFFSIYLNLPATLGSGVRSAPNRNEYQKQKNNVAG